MTQSYKGQDSINISFIGYGEAASALVKGWHQEALDIKLKAFDLKSQNPKLAALQQSIYQRDEVTGYTTLNREFAETQTIFSLVTADQASAAAQAISQIIQPGTWFFDGNSCSPHTKQHNATLIEAAGGQYVDMAIMSPVHPGLHKTPLLVSGAHSVAAATFLRSLQMQVDVQGDQVGQASAVKMVRSVMVKGMEALFAECVLAGRKAGVDATVLNSLQHTFPGINWQQQAAYNLERMIKHGERRATEMRAVSDTLQELGIKNSMANATAEWQSRIGVLSLSRESADYRELADDILQAFNSEKLG